MTCSNGRLAIAFHESRGALHRRIEERRGNQVIGAVNIPKSNRADSLWAWLDEKLVMINRKMEVPEQSLPESYLRRTSNTSYRDVLLYRVQDSHPGQTRPEQSTIKPLTKHGCLSIVAQPANSLCSYGYARKT
ncbi:hypothetical protein H6P81_014449 [Aristolochia fimbriata]|uniref:Uncharacterized protein n=1 Tax=Aristolochia fimbriata TaxID=158543 RepID=A0AAV7EKV9_ARIFI|nr:hypothetical protein H6P81_014449 [Aristolochia fimbriata]